jgi:hypothetical protein
MSWKSLFVSFAMPRSCLQLYDAKELFVLVMKSMLRMSWKSLFAVWDVAKFMLASCDDAKKLLLGMSWNTSLLEGLGLGQEV